MRVGTAGASGSDSCRPASRASGRQGFLNLPADADLWGGCHASFQRGRARSTLPVTRRVKHARRRTAIEHFASSAQAGDTSVNCG